MSERKLQNKYVPLRLRIRPSAEQVQWERENLATTGTSTRPLPPVPDLNHISETQRHAQQIKELIRLGHLLRADLGLNEVLQQIVASIAACIGFRSSVIRLIEEDGAHLSSVALAGLSEEDQQILRDAHAPIGKLVKLMRPDFRISQRYFISQQDIDVFSDFQVVTRKTPEDDAAGGWHREDAVIVPLFSPREHK